MPETSGKPLTIEDFAPYPKVEEEATAENLARYMAVEAHWAATLNSPRFQLMMAAEKSGENYADLCELYSMNQALMTAEHAVAFLLHEVKRLAPEQADGVAARMWDHWEDPPLQALTWDVLNSYGIDPERVSAAALARWDAAKPAPTPVPLPLGEEQEPGDVWKVSDETVPIGGVAPESFVSCPAWNDGHPVEIVEIEDGTRAYGVTFAAWRDVRKPEGRSTIVRIPSDMQVAPCTLNGTTGEES